MDNRPTYTEEVSTLLNSPSIFLWEIEIRKLLSGKRDHVVSRLGSAQEYIEVLLAQSPTNSAAVAETMFRQALRNVIQEWQPLKPESNYFLGALLDLIAAYTPQVGFVKILARFNNRERFSDDTTQNSELYLRALLALENYYPVPPHETFQEGSVQSGFVSYVALLRELLANPSYSAYALRRLMELEVVVATDNEVVNVIRDDVQAIHELLPMLLKKNRRSRASRDLALIYIQGLVSGEDVDEVFKEAAKLSRAKFQPVVPPMIVFENGEVIKFYFTAEELEQHANLRRERERVSSAIALTQRHEPNVRALTEILEQVLNESTADMHRVVKMVNRHGLYLEPAEAGPALYLPHGVSIPLELTPAALQRYLTRFRFADEPLKTWQSFVKRAVAEEQSKSV